jgi:uncharacterized protein (DUF924 family)
MLGAHDIVDFWRSAGPKKWFGGGAAFDRECESTMYDAHFAAALRALDSWMDNAQGALALQILLDQVPRNIFRGTAHCYATDPLARDFARQAIQAGFDTQTDADMRLFFYLPFEHSEVLADQERGVALTEALGDAGWTDFARRHRALIARFGRFPHRNAILGRDSTPEELAALAEPGNSF